MTQPNAIRSTKTPGTRYIAIDLDAEGMIIVSGVAGSSGSRVEHAVAWLPGDEHGPPALTAATAEKLGEELRDRLKYANIAAAPVLVGIGRDKVILKDIKHPPVDSDSEPAIVRFQALKEITESPDEIVLDYTPVAEDSADPQADRRAMVVVVRLEYYESVQAMIAAAGLKIAAVTPRPFAVAAGLAHALASRQAPPLESPLDAAAVVTLGPQGGEFTVVRAGKVAFTRAVPSQVLVNDALLLGEVKRNLTTYNGQNAGHPVKALYVPEAEHMLGGWSSRLQNLPVPIHTYDPAAGAIESVPAKQRGRYAGAAGLLAGKSGGLPINFASPRQPVVKKDPKRKLYIASAIAAAVLLLGTGTIGYLAVDSADEEVARKQAEKANLEKLLADAQPDHKRLEAAEKWEARGVNYLDELYEMSSRLPQGDALRVTSFKGTAIRPDKNGKQIAQAELTIGVAGKNVQYSRMVMDKIVGSNTKAQKFYSDTKTKIGGQEKPIAGFNESATITTRVFHRPPTDYTTAPPVGFKPPRRTVTVGTTAAKEAEKKPAETKPDAPDEPDE
jgi:hypothetical protein